MRITLVFITLVIFCTMVLMGCAADTPIPATATPTEHPGKALVSSRCGTCHAIGLVENARNNQAGWDITVDRMIMNGAKIDQTQKIQIVEYLASTYAKD